jgi:NitT/TauT family transport system substrate-binding protein
MNRRHAEGWRRREFLGGLVLAGTTGFLGLKPEPVAAEPLPETTTLRLVHIPGICQAPQYVAEAFLQGERFTEINVER